MMKILSKSEATARLQKGEHVYILGFEEDRVSGRTKEVKVLAHSLGDMSRAMDRLLKWPGKVQVCAN